MVDKEPGGSMSESSPSIPLKLRAKAAIAFIQEAFRHPFVTPRIIIDASHNQVKVEKDVIPLFRKIDFPIWDAETGKIVSKWFGEKAEFEDEIISKAEQVPLHDLEDQIAEWHYRRHIPIPFTDLAIRPFWRDGRKAPPLPYYSWLENDY